MYTFRYETRKTGIDIDFIDVDNSTGTGSISTEEHYLRAEILRLTVGNGVDLVEGDHTGFSITTTGIIEFMVLELPANTNNQEVHLFDGANRLVSFQLDNDDGWDYMTGAGWITIDSTVTAATWYIIRIDIDIDAGANGQFSCYVYDSEYTLMSSVTNIEFVVNATKLDKIRLEQEQNGVGDCIFDCFGITGEGTYSQGDIQNAEVDVSNYLENTRIHDGIIPYKKIFTFDCHPNDEAYFKEGYYIDIWDVNEVLCFTGYIKTKSRNKEGIYKFSCHGMANEIFERTYDKSFSSDKTSEKLQDIIDNKLEFCYRDSSITATTIDWSYEYSRACIYMFNLARYLERQVVYIEPDGKVWSKDYNDLVKQSEYYLGTHNFREFADGTSGTDITDFVDSVILYDGACEIVSDWQSHKKVLRLTDDITAGEDPRYIHNITQATSGTHEFWIGTNNVTEYWEIRYKEEATTNINLRITGSAFDYYSGAAWVEICTMANDTFYHIKIVWRADNKLDVYVNDIKEVDDIAMPANMSSGINKVQISGVGDSTDYLYLEAYGEAEVFNYNVGDNLLAGWYLYDGNQNALLIDIPGLRDSVPGYYFGNTGITSVSVRYKDNTTVIRPATPTETFKKKRLKEFRDPKLQASTEANQLGDHLYDIFSKDTIFLGMQIKGEGWLQPGKVIAIINTNQIAITAEAFLILKVVYDPKNDVHISMILSNNIITPDEFKSDLDTSSQQVHTATLQSFENQNEIATHTNQTIDHFVWRTPEATVNDFDQTTLAAIGDVGLQWYDLDLSSIIPEGTTSIQVLVFLRRNAVGSYFSLRQNGQTSELTIIRQYTQVSGNYIVLCGSVGVDSNRKIEFMAVPKASDWTTIALRIISWTV